MLAPSALFCPEHACQRTDPRATRLSWATRQNFNAWEVRMVKIAILDDWQDVARKSADWSRLAARAELVFFADAFGSEDHAARALEDFDILLTMRERTAFPETLIRRLPKLRMISVTGASNPLLDIEACARQRITICNTGPS